MKKTAEEWNERRKELRQFIDRMIEDRRPNGHCKPRVGLGNEIYEAMEDYIWHPNWSLLIDMRALLTVYDYEDDY